MIGYARVVALILGLVLPAGNSGPFAEEFTDGHGLKELLDDPTGLADVDATLLNQTRTLYAALSYHLIWSGSREAEAHARVARNTLQRADEQGLKAADYVTRTPDHSASQEELARADAALTRNVLAYARDVSTGRLSPAEGYQDAALTATPIDIVGELLAAIEGNSVDAFLARLPPPHEEYGKLVTALARYRGLAKAGGWPIVPAGKEIKIGSEDPRLEILKRRLDAENPGYARVDVTLVTALKEFQSRNGLDPDGRVGPRTLEMLNVPVSERIDQIIANMERWRWMPRVLERRYIAVNSAEQTLQYVEKGMQVLSSRVIVGRPQSPTPIFRAMATAVTANPPWNVPKRIAAREILPKLKRNPDYLVSQDMILVNGPPGDPQGTRENWRRWTAANFPYQIRQLPGEMNALGALKLELPNRFDVYLHDTPGKAAFARNDRALSHGCIRVQHIVPLAELALGESLEEAAQKLHEAIASGVTQRLALSEPLPVYVLYWTAIGGNDGSVGFRRDIYGRDRQLTTVLGRRASQAKLALRPSLAISCAADV